MEIGKVFGWGTCYFISTFSTSLTDTLCITPNNSNGKPGFNWLAGIYMANDK